MKTITSIPGEQIAREVRSYDTLLNSGSHSEMPSVQLNGAGSVQIPNRFRYRTGFTQLVSRQNRFYSDRFHRNRTAAPDPHNTQLTDFGLLI